MARALSTINQKYANDVVGAPVKQDTQNNFTPYYTQTPQLPTLPPKKPNKPETKPTEEETKSDGLETPTVPAPAAGGASGGGGSSGSGSSGGSTTDTQTTTEQESVANEPTVFTYDPFTYDPFSYGDYYESDAVNQANALLQQHQGNKPGAYQSQWQSQIDEAFYDYTNRDPFSYDFNADALYQLYKDNYIQQGQMAMMDTMGQAAAMTGGYGNSYAQTVGQQAYNQQLNQLNDVIPELYEMAYEQYDREGTNLYNKYNMLLAKENKDYARYQDDLSNWYKDLDYLTERYETERDLDYDKWLTGREQAYEAYITDKNLAYDEHIAGREQAWEAYLADQQKEQYAAELMADLGQYERLADIYGLSADELSALQNAYTQQYYDTPIDPEYTVEEAYIMAKNAGASTRELDEMLKAAVAEGELTMDEATEIRHNRY